MASNDRIILDQVLDQQRQNIAPSENPTKFFEIYTAEQILKDYDLSYDEIEIGIVAGGGDGGIDSFYVFVNGELLQDDSDFSELRKNITIDVFIIQSKTASGFSEAAIDRLTAATDDLFNLSKPIKEFTLVYNEQLLEAVERFRITYQALASRFPKLRLYYHYVTKGDEVHPNVQRKVTRLESTIKAHFSAAEFSFNFLGSRELLQLARRTPTTTYQLKLTENPISATGDVAYVCLVSLKDFHQFITDSQDRLIRHIFEANVRDYQGKTQVNEEIQASLQQPSSEDFWWLNNGITVLASRATQSGKIITVENPEIVNGLQTSTEIHNYFSLCNTDSEQRNLLVRVIVPNAPESRDRIIKATNSQTAIPPASLRATDRIHRDIEEYLRPFGFYYDRRKNFYKNEGKPVNRIIGIPQMAQATMAIVLRRPDTARARPSSLIKRDEEYLQLFKESYPIEIYRACARILKKTEEFLNVHPDNLSPGDKNNIKFYVAMAVAREALTKYNPSVSELSTLAGIDIDDSVFSEAYELVNAEYKTLGGTDKVAKGSELVTNINQKLTEKYP
ncbi:MAG: AIPR family protein [Desulfobaccales bacterium]